MKAEDIKAAAAKLADLERIEQILTGIRQGSAFTLQCGAAAVYLDRSKAEPITRALENYLNSARGTLKQDLAEVEDIEDPFDSVLEKLEADARPQ